MELTPPLFPHLEGSFGPEGVSIVETLELERIERDLFRAPQVFEENHALFGGQVAAQALLAAGRTVPEGRQAHSLQGYFLRPGKTGQPVVFEVARDRDGGTFSARRVVALQDGEVILNMGLSFQLDRGGDSRTFARMPPAAPPGGLPASRPHRLVGFEQRLPPQPPIHSFPRWAWLRCTEPLPEGDPHFQAALLTYVSDLYSGFGSEDSSRGRGQDTISHALWLHEPARLDEWVFMELDPERIHRGRGLYTGRIWSADGRHLGSLAQEAMYVLGR